MGSWCSALRMFPLFVWRDIREQYAGSWLGLLWSVLQPLLFILLYWWVFARILQMRLPAAAAGEAPFIAFLLSALLPWFAFQDGISRGAGAVAARREVVKKVYFPVQVFPLAAVAAAFVNHLIGFVLFLLVFFLWRGQVTWGQLVVIGLLLLIQIVATAGVALLLAAITVYIRDTTQVIGVALAALFYMAPIIYPLALVPEEVRGWYYLNPFTAFAEAYHNAVLWAQWPAPGILLGLAAFATLAGGVGYTVFRRLEPGFSDVL